MCKCIIFLARTGAYACGERLEQLLLRKHTKTTLGHGGVRLKVLWFYGPTNGFRAYIHLGIVAHLWCHLYSTRTWILVHQIPFLALVQIWWSKWPGRFSTIFDAPLAFKTTNYCLDGGLGFGHYLSHFSIWFLLRGVEQKDPPTFF